MKITPLSIRVRVDDLPDMDRSIYVDIPWNVDVHEVDVENDTGDILHLWLESTHWEFWSADADADPADLGLTVRINPGDLESESN